MNFISGFMKLAAEPIVFSGIGKALKTGLKAAGGTAVKDAINPLKGAAHIGEAAKKSGGWGKAFTTQAGREHMAEGIGKAAPHAAVAGAAAYGAKKVYNKVSGGSQQQQGGYY